MAIIEDKSFSSVFGSAVNGIEFDHVLEADDDDDIIESVIDFDETQGENDKTPADIEDELEGREDDGPNNTDNFDPEIADESAYDYLMLDEGIDFDESQGEDHKNPKDIEDELEGRKDDGCNKHTSGFDPYTTHNTVFPGSGYSGDKDIHDLNGATSRAAFLGDKLYRSGNLSLANDLKEDATVEIIDNDNFESEELTGEESAGDMDDYDGDEDFDFTDDYDGDDDFEMDEAAAGGDESEEGDVGDEDIDESYMYYEGTDDGEDIDLDDDIEESVSEDEEDEDADLDESYMYYEGADEDDDGDGADIEAIDSESDGEMSDAEVAALVAAGGDDDILDNM